MKFRVVFCAILLFVGAELMSANMLAQEKQTPSNSPAPSQAQMEEMMKKYQEISLPGPAHERFKSLVGTWNVTNRAWMDPKSEPVISKGTCEYKLILGGRYLVQEFHSTFMGQPFHGMALVGYDNFRKQYTSTWVDSMSTAIMVSTGTGDASGKVFTYTGTMDDPVLGIKDKVCKSIERIIDQDTHVFEMYDTIPDQGEFKMMEITYTRKK